MAYSPLQSSQRTDRILVVDDAPDNRFLVQSILQDEGYEVEVAEDGITALQQIGKLPPTLILLDVMMPGMDGFEVTRQIRNNTALPFIPILLITAYDQPSVAQGLDSGADDFIRKPVEFDELLARVRSLLRLKHSVDERDEIARQREDFVSRLTHDLRTPLVAADRMLTLFEQGALGDMSPEMAEAVVIMARSNKNLLGMVNQLLEVYRYEAGRKTLTFKDVDLKPLVEEVVQSLLPLASEKDIKLQAHGTNDESDPSRVCTVMGDRLELNRILTNLIGNAIKFTDAGKVDVFLTCPAAATVDSQRWVTIEVRDTGPGISPEAQEHLFERFQQGKHGQSGSGLGLYLSRRIVEAHQGEISVDSKVDQGSSFTVRLPAHQS